MDPNHPPVEHKSHLLKAYLKNNGLVKPHIESYNYFVETELKNIIAANSTIKSDVDPHFFMEFTDIRVMKPDTEQDMTQIPVYPQECRLRDLTYSAQIYVDIRYRKGKINVSQADVPIGRMPVMLRSSRCNLSGLTQEHEFSQRGECPLDVGGYFITRGTEKVILIQEQLSKNRIIVDMDKRGAPEATVTSSTMERKSMTRVCMKNGCVYLKHNCLNEDVPIVIALKAMGVVSDIEVTGLICGKDSKLQQAFSPSLEESTRTN